MPSVYLVRHCDYDNPRNILPGRLPVPLSEKGRQQAATLATYFQDKQITQIYSSAVERCKETSTIIAAGKIPITYDSRILETFSAYQGYWGENQHRDGFHFYSHRAELGGESLADIQKRMADFWDDIALKTDQNVIICSHGDPLQVLYSYVYNLPLVDDNEQEENIPGWIQKGDFKEVVIQRQQVVKNP